MITLTSIETYHDGETALCKVIFSNGLFGFGQCGNKDVDITVELVHRRVAPALLSKSDPLTLVWNVSEMLLRKKVDLISPIAERVFSFELNYKMLGVQLSKAIAGVDAAIWDALAKHHNLPVWKLWSETFFPSQDSKENTVRVYASSIARAVKPIMLADKFRKLSEDFGIDAFKMKVGVRMEGTKNQHKTPEEMSSIREDIITVQRRIGKNCKLALDANGGFAFGEDAEKVCSGLDVLFLEEPLPWYRASISRSIPRKTEQSGLLLAGGEQEFRSDVWEQAITKKIFDIFQPDFGYSGGPSNVVLIALRCITDGLICAPHSPQNDFHIIMAYHLLKSTPSVNNTRARLELACVDDGYIQVRLDSNGVFRPKFCQSGGVRIQDGAIYMLEDSSTSGWGLLLDEQWLAKSEKRVTTMNTTGSTAAKRSFL